MVSPAKDVKAPSLTKFQWSSVTDPSGGVTYNFQLSQDPNFGTIILKKDGLTETSYQLTDTEKLKSASQARPYYWRVQAVDGASNVSAWSTPQTFVVGYIMPQWLLVIIYIAAAIFIFAVGLFVGRKWGRGYGF